MLFSTTSPWIPLCGSLDHGFGQRLVHRARREQSHKPWPTTRPMARPTSQHRASAAARIEPSAASQPVTRGTVSAADSSVVNPAASPGRRQTWRSCPTTGPSRNADHYPRAGGPAPGSKVAAGRRLPGRVGWRSNVPWSSSRRRATRSCSRPEAWFAVPGSPAPRALSRPSPFRTSRTDNGPG